MKLNPQAKTFYAIIDNNASGNDMIEQQEEILKAKGGKIIKKVQVPLGNADFSSHLTEALSLKPDALIFNCYGTGNTNMTKQLYEFGISKKMPVMSGFGGMTMLRGLPPDAPEGIYYGVNWWHTYDNKWSDNFAAKYKKEYGSNPEDLAVAGYTGMWLVLQAAERVKSLKTKDLVLTLEKFGEYDGPTGKEILQAWDHQVVHPYLVGRGKAAKDKKEDDDYLQIVGTAKEYPNPTAQDSTCKVKIKDGDL
jgi:branched-chain amino acid transport system substrate-binding protein